MHRIVQHIEDRARQGQALRARVSQNAPIPPKPSSPAEHVFFLALDPCATPLGQTLTYGELASGRIYVQSDPIGLEGGSLSLYTYADDVPTSKTDPLGLTTYMCTKPLHALGEAWGPRLYPESRFNPSPFYHQFVCVPDGNGGMTCGGQDRGEGPFGPGKTSDDTFKLESCKPADEDKCVEQCLLPKLTDPNRQAYSLFGGGGTRAGSYNCQQWADKKVQECQQQCKAK